MFDETVGATFRPVSPSFLSRARQKGTVMSLRNVFFISAITLTFTGCASIASGTNTLTDEKIKSQTSGALGYSPDDILIVSRRTEGTNTYTNLKAKDGKEFTCIINGGNLLTMGMVNPPMCSKKGEPINTNPFHK
jgi:hypothetical protein